MHSPSGRGRALADLVAGAVSEISRKTGAGKPEGPEPRPIKFLAHDNPVKFRNVWVQRLKLD